MSDIDRAIESITLTIGHRTLAFPHRAFADLSLPGEPTAVFEHGEHDTWGRFEIHGGDGEKSYVAAFNFDKEHLLSREVYRHMDNKPTVLRFTRND